MKLWTSEHLFEHHWETVAKAAKRKYPNPINQAVTGVDVLDRKLDSNGILSTHRLMITKWSLPSWVHSLLGSDPTCYASEFTRIDPAKRELELISTNITLGSLITLDEKLVYKPHPDNKDHTLLSQEAHIHVHGLPFSGHLEGVVEGNYSSNAGKGRQAIEWVITNIKKEMMDLKKAATKFETSLPTPSSAVPDTSL